MFKIDNKTVIFNLFIYSCCAHCSLKHQFCQNDTNEGPVSPSKTPTKGIGSDFNISLPKGPYILTGELDL